MRLASTVFGCLLALTVNAAPFAVQLGDTRVGLDAPPGFSDSTFTGSPRLQDLAETLTSASNRILLFAISDADLRRFTVGDTPEFRRYMIAVTPKGLERDRVNAAAFNAFVGDATRELGSPPPDGDFAKHLDAQPPGKVSLLSELRRDPEVVSVLQGTRLPGQARFNEPQRYLLSTTTLLLLRGKALSLQVYSAYDNPADLDWIRATTARWVEELQRLNNR
jgi:hypothetical protein